MEEKIKEVQAYFIAKILDGEFIVIKKEEGIWSILIDNKYTFNIWIVDHSIGELYDTFDRFMTLEMTEKEENLSKKLFSDLKAKEDTLKIKRDKMRQYNALKKELGL